LQLLILAAGMGRRLDPLTRATPKCLVEVNGRPIILNALDNFAPYGLQRIVIVIGHLGDQVREALGTHHGETPIHYVENPVYEDTNNIYSLWLAREYCDRDTILMEADVLFQSELAEQLCAAMPGNIALVDVFKPHMDGTVVEVNDRMEICNVIPGAMQTEEFDYRGKYKTVNVYAFQADYLQRAFVPALHEYMQLHGKDKYYELVISALITSGNTEIKALPVTGPKWIEIDDFVDLERAEIMFLAPQQVYQQVEGLYGGFWRYDFLDYSYLYNLYFPPVAMLSELRRNMGQVLRNYPSGLREILVYLQNWVGVEADRLVIGNGASEIIAAIKRTVLKRMTIAIPSFNEYYDGLPDDKINFYRSELNDFAIDLMAFTESVEKSGSNVAVLVNPDLPSGRMLKKAEIAQLLQGLAHLDLVLVDESFIEFADLEQEDSLLTDLDLYPNLLVVRSLSKDLGVPGLRLGYAATSSQSLVNQLRRELPIWNINGLAEYFLAVLPKYRREFEASRRQVIADREYFYARLTELPGIRVFPSSSNYFLVRLPLDCPSDELKEHLFINGNILVKDCTNKAGLEARRYIRIAVRTQKDSDEFILRFCASLAYFSPVSFDTGVTVTVT
jgi:histidinol-phosphate/aromatic aminotransferase/cobyric acid decarboxylase-like protein/choline kinase